jgi:hypothetical protein
MKILALAFLVLASNIARAAIFCPANEADLRQALATAAANNEDDEIRLRVGTFYSGGQEFAITTSEARNLVISGGWSDSLSLFCSVQSPSAAATILDGQNVTTVLDINAYAYGAGSAAATVSVSNLTLRNGYTNANNESAGLFAGIGYQTFRLEHTVLLGHTHALAGGNIYTNAITLVGSGDIYVVNNAMSDLHSHYANLGIFTGAASQTVYLTNNTLSLDGAGFPALLDANNGTAYRIVNNAIIGPLYYTLYFNSRNASDPIRTWMYNNIGTYGINTLFNGIALQADSGNIGNIDPKFVSATDLRPAVGSPLVNAGLNSPYGGVSAVDLDGNPRVDLGTIDVGAWESALERIFTNSFD